MAEQTVLGVDFSGAQSDKNTWMTKGVLTNGVLRLSRPHRIKRNELAIFLQTLESDAVAALDFPFGVPLAFANFLAAGASTMPELWEAVARKEYDCFKKSLDHFVEGQRQEQQPLELIRCGDVHFDGPMSPLNIRMKAMTYHGMKMMHHLHKTDSSRWCIPPLNCPAWRDQATLLEVMPGVLLRFFDLPVSGYKQKTKTNPLTPKEVRQEIFEGLVAKAKMETGIAILNPELIKDECIGNDNALDSLVASVGAAMWAKRAKLGHSFREPDPGHAVGETASDSHRLKRVSPKVRDMVELEAARAEGWIYAPKKG